MATASGMSLSSEHVQRLLQCAVCLETFKQPKLLPCQHTLCLSPCLEGLVEVRTRSVRCPECRADHFVPRGGPANFPNNLTIIAFLELSAGPARAAVREDEAGGRRAIPVPREAFQPPGEAEDDQAVAEDPLVADVEAGPLCCSVCRDERSISRCLHCDQLVCEDCRRAHLTQVRADVTRMISQIRRSLPQLTDQLIALARKETQFQNRCDDVKTDISEVFEKHIRDLKARERVLLEEVDVFTCHELRNLRGFQETVEMENASLASFCDSAEAMLSLSRPVTEGDLIEMKRQCLEHLETVQCYEDGITRPPTIKQIQASMESSFLSSTINNFGDLIITSRPMPNTDVARPSRADVSAVRSEWDLNSESRLSRASVPPQLGRPSNRAVDRVNHVSRAMSISPTQGRRERQVNFELDERSSDSTTGLGLRPRRCPNRYDRYERRSDSRLVGLGTSRAPSMLRQMQERTRHRSLGGIPLAADYLDETDESPDTDNDSRPFHSQSQSNFQRGDLMEEGEREDEERLDSPEPSVAILSTTYPGARSSNFLPPSLQHGMAGSGPSEIATIIIDRPGNQASSTSNTPSVYVSTPRNKYNQKGNSVYKFGRRGNGLEEFTCPRGVAASPMDDKIYVADSSNHRVQVFTNTGRYIRMFGRYGQGDGEFDCLAGIAVNELGQVIIADRYNHRVQIFDRNGVFQRAFGSEGRNPGQLNYPWGVACDNMGFIYVCDKENNRVQVFQSNGSYVRMFGSQGSQAGQFVNPHYIAVSPDNKVYVSDSSNHRIQVFSLYGDFIFSFGTCGNLRGQMKFPRGIAIDNQGFVVVADSGNNRIQIFRSDGRFYSMFGSWGSDRGYFKGLEGLAILADGKIVVGDRENHSVQIF
ncbi:RING finger protein nhl-1-like [Plakobranchus ocellatus]|uniref:RING finger protein nhl-1-like n=1 Tax=Plakobranchus ocellatus TaxID=259542 RepID=A0AAV4D1H9_9GAST|nr:RING finger protein nhl-1-like [Plakobranchus ocellatus]